MTYTPDYYVDWVKNTTNGQYFDFLRLDLNSAYFNGREGVYVIWYASPSEARVIRVGQGNIGERLKEHISNWQITQFSKSGQLKVTWALVPKIMQDGIEAFLFDYYRPLVGERTPSVNPVKVNPI